VGTSKSKVEKVRRIIDHADDETKEAVKSGEISINKAYQETKEPKILIMGGVDDKLSTLLNKIDGTRRAVEKARATWLLEAVQRKKKESTKASLKLLAEEIERALLEIK